MDELADEWEATKTAQRRSPRRPHYTPEQLADLRREMAQLREFHALAKSITKNSKGEVLLTALRRGFAAAAEAKQGSQGGATLQQKAVIFTESRRTQEYLFRVSGADRVRRQGDALQRHEHRSQVQGNLPELAEAARRDRSHHRLAQRRHARRVG